MTVQNIRAAAETPIDERFRHIIDRWKGHHSSRAREVSDGWTDQTRLVMGLAVFTDHRTTAIANITGLTTRDVLRQLRACLDELSDPTRRSPRPQSP